MSTPTMSTDEIIRLMDAARFDPSNQLRNLIRRTNEIVDGRYRLVDPTNPFIFLAEMACAGAANTAIHHEAEMRRRHPMLAHTKEDLYFHLTDRQYKGAFAIPPVAPIGVIIPVEEIFNNAVEIGNSGVKMLAVAKNSVWRVNGYAFTLEYPIEFKIMLDGGLTVGLGNPITPALHKAESNIVEFDRVNFEGHDCIRFKLPVRQMAIRSEIIRINNATTELSPMVYTDKFHYLRAFIRRTVNGVNRWVEIITTHSQHVYDPYKLTLLVRDMGGEVRLTLPAVYQSSGMVDGEMRIDLYTTKAQNDVILTDFPYTLWEFEPIDFDRTDNNLYTAPFSRISTMISFSDGFTRGGRDELSFEELRDRIMEVHYGPVDEPITQTNHSLTLADRGFSTVKELDTTTQRVFSATRTMPLPNDTGFLKSPMNVGVFNTLLRISDLEGVSGISINGDRATIHPSVLFKHSDGGVQLVSETEREWLKTLTGDVLARNVSSGNYLFTPFYSVLDATLSNFDLRVYDLDSPSLGARQYIMGNPTLLLDLYTSSNVVVEKTEQGYRLLLLTTSGSTYKDLRDDQVGIQLSFIPIGETQHKTINGTLVSKDTDNNRLFSFDIVTNYDINHEDELTITNFNTADNGPQPNQMPLDVTMDICYFVNDYPVQGIERTSIDDVLNQHTVPAGSKGILQESVVLKIGTAIKNMWTGARSTIMPTDYLTYDHDMPRRYDKPVYERRNADGELDENGELVVTQTPEGLVVNKLHEVGDLVLLPDGSQDYEYRVGDYVVVAGNYVPKSPRELTRQMDLVLFDGLFYFANNRLSTQYLEYVKRNIVEWSVIDMGEVNRVALDETTVKFKPLVTLGSLAVVVGEGGDIFIEAEQSLKVDVYMTEAGWKNETLKEGQRSLVIDVVVEEFSKENISIMNMINSFKLKNSSNQEILGISISGLGGENYSYPLISLKDGSGRPSIRQKLTPLPNDQYTVEEDISINFIPHLPARSDR